MALNEMSSDDALPEALEALARSFGTDLPARGGRADYDYDAPARGARSAPDHDAPAQADGPIAADLPARGGRATDDNNAPAKACGLTIDDVQAFVAGHVARLLDDNPGLLMSILYRIDVAEPKVRHILESEPPNVMVERLTALIIERQLEKVRLRRRFRQDEND